MYMMKGLLTLFISLALGYALCVVANKQKGLLRTVGYTLGIAIIALSLLCGAIESCAMSRMKSKHSWGGDKGMKCHSGNFMKGRVK